MPIARAIDRPGRDGWDAVAHAVYVTKIEESRVVMADASRKAATWYVRLYDGQRAAMDRRGAELTIAMRSLKVAGVEKESFAGRTPHALDGARLQQLASFIEQARRDADIPGVAIGVVQGGKLVYEQGFGVKDRGTAVAKAGAVGPATLFLIGSNTKSLTSLLMARLVDRGVFSWTTPVIDILPSFALGDAEVTRKLTMQHTVCACTGLPREDLRFWFEYAGITPEDRVASMKTMVPTTGFGETFQYSNAMVSTGGYVAAHALAPAKGLGPAYDDAMQAQVFTPLGMHATTFDFAKATRANHAAPHGQAMSSVVYQPFPLSWEEGVIAVRPAGSAWSNVRDISRYLLLELGKGVTPEGKRVVSEANLLHRRDPQVRITDQASYGLGLMVVTSYGVQVVQHGGNNVGYSSDMYLLPEHGIGVVVLTNAGGAGAFLSAVRRRLFELLFDGRPEAAENLAVALAQEKKALEEEAALVKAEIDPAWLAPLLGEYRNAELGRVTVSVRDQRPTLDVGEWQAPLAEKIARDGTPALVTSGPAWRFALIPGKTDGKTSLTLRTPQKNYTFEAAPR